MKTNANRSHIVKSVILGSTFLLAAQSAQADTLSGKIAVSITLVNACLVNGAPTSANLSFGSINFGTRSTFFDNVTSSLTATGGGNATIQCTPGTTATAKLISGINDANATSPQKFAMANGTKYVSYDLYKEAALTNLINKNDTIFTANFTEAAGAAQTFSLYAKAYGKAGLTAGTYNDTLTVELSF